MAGNGLELGELAAGASATGTITRQLGAADLEVGVLAAQTVSLGGANRLKQAAADLRLPETPLSIAPAGQPTGKPGKAVLSSEGKPGSDGFAIRMQLRSGANATEFILLQDGKEIARRDLPAAAGGIQQAGPSRRSWRSQAWPMATTASRAYWSMRREARRPPP
ncbi:hypothetical protein [Glutamicibacter soli]